MRRWWLSLLGAGLTLLLAAGPALAAETHRVERGDTLWAIAQAHDTTWPNLFAWNRAIIDDPDLIFPGQVLTVTGDGPKAERTPQIGSADAAPSGTAHPATGAVTSSYGMRTHPITGIYKLHTGVDYSLGDGNAYAVRAGTVTGAGWVAGYGRMVTVDHGGGWVTRYAHLAEFTVNPGDQVGAGTVVGRIGSSGYSTGSHLHFEVLYHGEFVNPAGGWW